VCYLWLNVIAYCCVLLLLTLFVRICIVDCISRMSHITWTHRRPQCWTMPVRDGNPSENFLRPTPAHTRPRGPSSRVGIPIRRRRNPDPAHINSNLNRAIPIPYDQALYLANYWRHVSSYLALHLLIVSNTMVAFATAELPPNQGYRMMLANTIWPAGLPQTHDLSPFEMLHTLHPYLVTLIPLPTSSFAHWIFCSYVHRFPYFP